MIPIVSSRYLYLKSSAESKSKLQTFKSFVFFVAPLLFVMLLPAPSSAQVVQSGYTSIVAANSAKCLDINGGSSAAGAAAIQWHCNGGENEAWTVQPYSTGEFRIIVQFTGDCLVVSGGSTSSGASIVQEPCTGTNSELWSFVASGSNYEFVNKNSGQCASVSGASTADAAYIVQEPCSTAPSSLWAFTSGLVTPASLSVAQAAHSGQCLNVSGSSSKAGGIIIQWPCSGSPNEQWYMIPSGSHYMLEAHNSSLCLSNNGSTAQNAQLVQETCSTSNNDLWTLKPVGGSYEIIGANGGLCAEVTAASQTAAADVIQATCSAALNQLWSLSPATIPSSWTAVQPLPVDPIAVGNLPDGQLVMWSANDEYSFEGDIGDGNGQTYTATYDPVANVASEVLVTNTGDDMFCPGTANLFDGTILVNGGDSSPKTSLYSPASGLWTSDALMNIPRGYEGDTVLTNGSVLTLGGSWSGGQGGKTAEVWTRGSGWKVLSGVPETTIIGPDPAGVYRGDNHLWLFSAPNGEVFHAGPSAQMHWINTTGNGTITSAGNRGDDPYAMTGDAQLYDVGLIMKTGGSPAYQDANAEANTYIININNGTSGVTVTKVAPMAYPRAFANGVVLPNGEVVIIGGQTYPVPFSDATAILIPEIWNPVTRVFRQMNAMATPRVYHSTGILLPDGRVYEGGGGQCGEGCSANHFNTEILTPPYLLNSDGSLATRPVIDYASSTAVLGGTITATTASPVVSFVLMRLSSTTHTVNNDQRRIPLQMASTSGDTYTLTIPNNPGIVLPGYYWLFALNAQGVPSVAAVVLIS
jgi:galactose oxidase